MQQHIMVDIETTGVDKVKDDILEIGMIPINFEDGYWRPIFLPNEDGDYDINSYITLHLTLHSPRQPENIFAKENMADLYKRCNATNPEHNYEWAKTRIQQFIHSREEMANGKTTPKLFMGWNASNFDIPFIHKKEIMTPSYYVPVNGKEVLRGDTHYRIYEQTGTLNGVLNSTGMSKRAVFALLDDVLPKGVKLPLPEGKSHDAIYDCVKQINMQNGMLSLTRKGWNIFN